MTESVEWLLNEKDKEIAKLKEELEIAQKDIADFESLAIIWKKGHKDLLAKHAKELGNAHKTIEELEKELDQCKS